MPDVSRRIFTPQLAAGHCKLIDSEAHHVRDVLRLKPGDSIELFDETGRTAAAVVREIDRRGVLVDAADPAIPPPSPNIAVVSALPKGDRADWMVEKLSELGVTRLVLLITDRGVVVPKGAGKLDRFRRIAIESAKQSHRVGVMTISPPRPFADAIRDESDELRLVLTTQGESRPMTDLAAQLTVAPVRLFIGPEGGWTDDELLAMRDAGLTAVSLTATILRVETAAVAAAAFAACAWHGAAKG